MSQHTPFRIGLVQMSMSSKSGANLAKAITMIAQAARKGAQVICLPELFLSPYFCQREDVALFDLAEPFPGPTTDALAGVAREHGVAIVAPIFERAGAGVYYNSAATIDADGSTVGFYRKMHIPDDPAYYEKFYFTPGDRGFQACSTKFGRVSTLICWDQWFPEGARLSALQDPSVLFYPTAIGWHPYEKEQYGKAQREAWQTVMRGHAVANGIYVAAANRTGLERQVEGTPGIEFWGSSFICDPQGVIIAEASTDNEEVLVADVDPTHLENIRRNWPFLRDRRIDMYGDITRRYGR